MKRLAILLGTIGALFFGGAIYAQQAERVDIIPAVLTTGDYRDLNWYRRVKLGTAPYVNPDLMDNVTVAFTYDFNEVLSTAKKEAIAEELVSGKIAAAVPSSGAWKVHAYWDPIWFEKYGLRWENFQKSDLAEFMSLYGDLSMVFISQEEHLAGLDHKGKVVSWKKGVAVNAGSIGLFKVP